MNRFEAECSTPCIKRVAVLDLSDNSYGNAIGMGMCDFTTRRLVDKINHKATALNCITGGRPELGKIPIALDTDREAIETCLLTMGAWSPETARALWITNTKELTFLAASEALLADIPGRSDLERLGEAFELPFGTDGALPKLKTLFSA